MKKIQFVIFAALMAVVAMCGLNSCKEVKMYDVVTYVSVMADGTDAFFAAEKLRAAYVDAIVEAQGGEKITINAILLKNQEDKSKAKAAALEATNKVKAEVLAKQKLEVLSVPTPVYVFVKESTAEDCNLAFEIVVDDEDLVIKHYYEITQNR